MKQSEFHNTHLRNTNLEAGKENIKKTKDSIKSLVLGLI